MKAGDLWHQDSWFGGNSCLTFIGLQEALGIYVWSSPTTKILFAGGSKVVTYFLKKILFIFREGKQGRKKERNINVWFPLMRPLLGIWLATQVCALTGNQTGNPLVHRPALNPLSHTSQGSSYSFLILKQSVYNFLMLVNWHQGPFWYDFQEENKLCSRDIKWKQRVSWD